ncbi:guanylate kinase [Paucilactobacillus nenjiangensis]|uniref:guanylate kinase n=1 Tax=Paucilactobacillus nenjiangensis TaxID=1296540 RepID=UPI0028D63718|nr:AAA family ATPase [Paucilactobacillus nenjiangensis]
MMKRVLVITGATGSGKTTVSKYLQSKYHLPKVITHTTRKPREGETNGVDYNFETRESMRKLDLLEQVTYDFNLYGSSMEGLNQAWKKDDLVTIVLDTKGAVTYKQKLGDQAVIVFLTVSEPDSLKDRLASRGDERIALVQRIKSAEYHRDLKIPKQLDGHSHVIVNDDWNQTKIALGHIMDQLKA